MNGLFDMRAKICPLKLPPNSDCQAFTFEASQGYHAWFPGGEIIYVEQLFSPRLSDRILEYLQENECADWRTTNWAEMSLDRLSTIAFKNINWKQDWIRMFGKQLPLPRLTSWYGDSGKVYTYSGITSRPNEWNTGLLHLKRKIEQFAKTEFNSVLLNWYRSGNDYVSWHSDDEKELGSAPVIASASFGATRDFILRRKDDHSAKIVVSLEHGSLLLMKGETQLCWEHSIPKRKKVSESRFNLTFRRIFC